jgi:tetratricopeptide (TPR) repeat protein
MYLGAGRFDDSAAQLERTLEIDETALIAHWLLGQARLGQGRTDEGIAALRRAVELSGGLAWMECTLGVGLAVSGNEAEARAILNRLTQRAQSEYVAASLFATLHGFLGDDEQSFEWLDRAREARSR